MCLSKSVVLAMSAEATRIRDVRSSSAATGVSYTSDFRRPQKNKSKSLRLRKRGGQATGPPNPIHLPGYVGIKWLCPAIEKWAHAPPCITTRSDTWWLILPAAISGGRGVR
ncbi:hypothetical protein TNCV_2197351 [Trichonephila clavipes]|nr:hypothetical protein TNCV_2197351 [Trichonephila clavipes]